MLGDREFDTMLRDLSMEILDKLTSFHPTHTELIKNGILDFIKKEFDDFSDKNMETLKEEDLKELARLFQICSNLAVSGDASEEMKESGLVEKMIEIYIKNEKITFLRDILIKSLSDITSSLDGVAIVEQTNLDLQNLVHSALSSQNPNIVDRVELIVKNLANEEKIKEAIGHINEEEAEGKVIVYLSFLSSNSMYRMNFEDDDLLNKLMTSFHQTDSDVTKLGIVKVFKEICKIDSKYVNFFKEQKGLDQTRETIIGETNALYKIELIEFLTEAIKSAGRSFIDYIEQLHLINCLLDCFVNLTTRYEVFIKKAITNEKALDSIEYHKSNITRIILQTVKNITIKDVVPLTLALEYTSCNSLSTKLLNFFLTLKTVASDFNLELNDAFFTTCNRMMKVFSKSKVIHEVIFDTLKRFNYSHKQGITVLKLNWPFQLTNIILAKPNWKIFALYSLRFIESLMKNDAIIKEMKQGFGSIKLIACIQHFINEEDLTGFDEDEQIDNKEGDKLTYQQEREIYKKCSVLLDQLIDTGILITFKNNITKTIKTFNMKAEAVTILRAEYAVLTLANSINYFGCEGLNSNMHVFLENNIKKIEKTCKGRDFPSKEKLIADCIRSIANFVCITWNEKGKNLYENKGISVIVFGLFERYLKESKRPLNSYVILKAFREWLVNRIETIEGVSNHEREKIYDKESFMMVPLDQKEKIITNVMDSLYITHANFSSNQKVVTLNFEVIILLGYVYPEWKSRVAKNFIPQILEVLENEDLGKEADLKAIELLKQLIGNSDGSDSGDKELMNYVNQNGAVEKVLKSIADNNFDPEYTEACKDVLEQLGNDERNLEPSYNRIDQLVQDIEDYNKNKGDLKKLNKAVGELNSYCMVGTLKKYALDKGHAAVLNELWGNMQKIDLGEDKLQQQLAKEVEKNCLVGINEHIGDKSDDDDLSKVYGDISGKENNVIVNAVNTLKEHKREPDLVGPAARIINEMANGKDGDKVRELIKKLDFNDDLEFLFKTHGDTEKGGLGNEVQNLYYNLAEGQDDKRKEKNIKTVLKAFNHNLNGCNSINVSDTITRLLPLAGHSVFSSKFEELDIMDYIIRTLKLLHKNLQDSTGKDTRSMLDECLGSHNVPDISPHNKKLLEADIGLANRLFKLIANLPKELKERVKNNPTVVKLSDIIVLLDRTPDSFYLYNTFLDNPSNKKLLLDNRAVDFSTLVLMKSNKDSFKTVELTEEADLTKSMMTNLIRQSVLSKSLFSGAKGTQPLQNINVDDFKTASRPSKLENKKSRLTRNLDLFSNLMDNLLTPEALEDIIEEYIKKMDNYKEGDELSVMEALSSSRKLIALLKSQKNIDLLPYADKLKKAFVSYLNNCKGTKSPNKKLMKFFENIFGKVAKKLKNTEKSLEDSRLWNDMVDIYFVNNPDLVKNNPIRVFKNLKYASFDKRELKNSRVVMFREEDGYLFSHSSIEDQGHFNNTNFKNIKQIIANFKKAVDKNEISMDLFSSNLEVLSRSKQFCKEALDSELFGDVCSNIVFYDDFDHPDKFKDLSETLLNIINSIREDINLVKVFNEKIHADNILFNYIDNLEQEREELLPISMEVLQHLFEILNNRSPFYDKNLPNKLMTFLGPLKEWKDKPNALILAACIIQDPSLENLFKDLGTDNVIFETLKNDIIGENSLLENPDTFPFNEMSELSRDKNHRFCQLQAYLTGELSKYEEHAVKFINPENKLPDFVVLFNNFEKFENDPVLSTKLLETARNVIFKLDDETMKNKSEEINEIIAKIPDKLFKFKNFKLIPKYLQDILDYLKNFDERKRVSTMLSKLTNSLVRNVETEAEHREKLKDAAGLANVFKDMAEFLEDNELNSDQSKTLEIAEAEVNNLLEGSDTNAKHTLNNLDVPRNLRKIANSDKSNLAQKESALQLLNKFADNEDICQKMVADDFFVKKSAELINELAGDVKSFGGLDDETAGCLGDDLKFLEKLTGNEQGVEHAFKAIDEGNPIIDTLFKILESELDKPEIKADALKVLSNLLAFGNDKGLEEKVLKEIPDLFKTNSNEYDILCPLVEMVGVMAGKSDKAKMDLINKNVMENIKKGLEDYPDGKKLNANSAKAIFELCNEFAGTHDNILNSDTLPHLANNFEKTDSEHDMHDNTAKTLLQLSFKNNDRKLELIDQGFVKGLVPLLIHYSSKENFDPETCTLVLKCMANFSSIPKGVEELLQDGVIPAFRDFFAEYKDTLPEQNKFMMCTVSNLAYDPKEENIKKIIGDKGIELILATLKFYANKRDPETTEICIDALANISAHPLALDYLSKTNVIDILIDILRQQLNDRLCYKTLRCLTNFCKSDKLSKRFMDKGGHVVTISVLKPFRDDNKNVFQALKLLNILAAKYDNKLEEFAFAGVPEKVIQAFKEDWP